MSVEAGQWINCWKCNIQYWLPMPLYISAKANENISFFCPFGHSAHFPARATEADKLRLERDRLKQQIAQKDDEIKQAWNRATENAERANKAEKATKRLKKRASAGTCPCCSRTFANMASHMKHMHPDFVTESGAKVIPLKRATP